MTRTLVLVFCCSLVILATFYCALKGLNPLHSVSSAEFWKHDMMDPLCLSAAVTAGTYFYYKRRASIPR